MSAYESGNESDTLVFDGFLAFLTGIALCAALLCGCTSRTSAPALGDAGACRDACTHRITIGCIDPDPEIAANCIPACELSTAHGWYHPERVAVASREDMPSLGVRCPP